MGALRGRQSPELIRRWASELRANLLCRSRDFFERCITAGTVYRPMAQVGTSGTSSSTQRGSWATRSSKHAKPRHENDSLRHDEPVQASPRRVQPRHRQLWGRLRDRSGPHSWDARVPGTAVAIICGPPDATSLFFCWKQLYFSCKMPSITTKLFCAALVVALAAAAAQVSERHCREYW